MTTAISGSLLREVARLFTQSQSRSVERNSKMNSQCNLLAELERSGTLAMTELGRRVGREKSWVSRSVDALATRGLVVKEPNPADSTAVLGSPCSVPKLMSQKWHFIR